MVRFCTYIVVLATLLCVSPVFAGSDAAAAPVSAAHPTILLSAEHSLIVYAVGIIISLGTAVMIKVLCSALRATRRNATESA